MSHPVLCLSLPCTEDAPRLARTAVSELGALDPVRDDVTLVVSELVANAVVHSGSVNGDSITLRVDQQRGALSIWVRDPGRSPDAPHLRTDGALGRGGLGLVIVDQLAQRWASTEENGRVVQAWLTVPSAASPDDHEVVPS